ncbi:MAG: DUF2461 domain-containing protein [Spirochaetales bacterium]|nr:DUF2461 domain-containing protein [Spirochaetales bacterium]
MEKIQFNGFPKQILRFFSQLTQNNNREWFLAHKEEYETYVLKPSRAFIITMGNKLKKISKKIHAIPRVNKSIFRIHRDTRFHKSGCPYNTNLGILFWEGPEKRRIWYPGFYFHLEKRILVLCTGVYEFSSLLLKKYREKLSCSAGYRELQKILAKISENNHIIIEGKRLKKNPTGYAIPEENKLLMKYKGLRAMYTVKTPEILHKPELADFCFEKYSQMAPLHRWMVRL